MPTPDYRRLTSPAGCVERINEMLACGYLARRTAPDMERICAPAVQSLAEAIDRHYSMWLWG